MKLKKKPTKNNPANNVSNFNYEQTNKLVQKRKCT